MVTLTRSFETLVRQALHTSVDHRNPAWLGDRWHWDKMLLQSARVLQHHLQHAQNVLIVSYNAADLLEYLPHLPPQTVVLTNVSRRFPKPSVLQSHGRAITIVGSTRHVLPFPHDSFDVIFWNGFSLPMEAGRLLRSGGRLVHEWRGQYHLNDLREMLGFSNDSFWRTLPQAMQRFAMPTSREISNTDVRPCICFEDIGALIYGLRVLGWRTRVFMASQPYQKLYQLHCQLESQPHQPLCVHQHYGLRVCEKS